MLTAGYRSTMPLEMLDGLDWYPQTAALPYGG
jgi:hypothetical protein